MLETVVAWQARNPRQELSRYLEDLVEQVKNIIGWWGVGFNLVKLDQFVIDLLS
jgi:hypothetical protein